MTENVAPPQFLSFYSQTIFIYYYVILQSFIDIR